MRPALVTALPGILLQMARQRPVLTSINVTNRCTERCPMCSVWQTPLPELDTAKLSAAFAELRRFGVRIVEISGGEPFLRSDLAELLAALDRVGLLSTLTTNATVAPGPLLTALASTRGLLQLAVSLDSLDRERYALLRGCDLLPEVLANLEILRAARLPAPLKLNVTVSRVNYREVPELLRFAAERGLFLSAFPVNVGEGFHHRHISSLFSATDYERREMAALFRDLARRRREGEPLWEYSGFYELAAAYLEGLNPGPCGAGRLYLDIRADGGVAPCVDLPVVGRIGEEPLEQIWLRMQKECACRINQCRQETPCCYTCTYNVQLTSRNRTGFLLETLRTLMKRRCVDI